MMEHESDGTISPSLFCLAIRALQAHAHRLRCSELPSANARDIIFYNASGQREDEYMFGGG